MGYRELEEICRAALTRKDLEPRDTEFWKDRLAWVERMKRGDGPGD